MADRIGNMAAHDPASAVLNAQYGIDNLCDEIAALREVVAHPLVAVESVDEFENRLRDSFAHAALPAVIQYVRSDGFEEIAERSYKIADAMLAERRRRIDAARIIDAEVE